MRLDQSFFLPFLHPLACSLLTGHAAKITDDKSRIWNGIEKTEKCSRLSRTRLKLLIEVMYASSVRHSRSTLRTTSFYRRQDDHWHEDTAGVSPLLFPRAHEHSCQIPRGVIIIRIARRKPTIRAIRSSWMASASLPDPSPTPNDASKHEDDKQPAVTIFFVMRITTTSARCCSRNYFFWLWFAHQKSRTNYSEVTFWKCVPPTDPICMFAYIYER